LVNWIWLGMIVISFWFAALTGKMEEVTAAAFSGAQTGVTVCLGLIGILVLWMGLMRVAEEAGLVQKLAVLIGPAVRWLFPDVPRNHPAMGYILSNLSANLLGLGNAATPMGIRAMQELQKLNPDPQTANARHVHPAGAQYREHHPGAHDADRHPTPIRLAKSRGNHRIHAIGHGHRHGRGHRRRSLVPEKDRRASVYGGALPQAAGVL